MIENQQVLPEATPKEYNDEYTPIDYDWYEETDE